MNKETSSHVSTIAAEYLHFGQADLVNIMNDLQAQVRLVTGVRALAASCLSQNEHKEQTKGEDLQNFGDVLFRLKHERDELEHKLISLNSFLHHNRNFPAPNHRDMLARQSTFMSEYLAVLDERIADLEILKRSDTTAENINDD